MTTLDVMKSSKNFLLNSQRKSMSDLLPVFLYHRGRNRGKEILAKAQWGDYGS